MSRLEPMVRSWFATSRSMKARSSGPIESRLDTGCGIGVGSTSETIWLPDQPRATLKVKGSLSARSFFDVLSSNAEVLCCIR